MMHIIVWLFYRVFWKQINVPDEKICANCNEAAIRELLTIRAEAECEHMHRFRKITGSVNEPKSNDPGMIPGTHYPCIFRNLCVKEAYVISIQISVY